MDYQSRCPSRFIVFLLINMFYTVSSRHIQKTNITTRLGNLTGTVEAVEFGGKIKTVSIFRGIPYAKPPLSERRFTRPEPFGNLRGYPTYDATFYRPHCIQIRKSYRYLQDVIQSEDCLYLNIFVPGTSVDRKLNVHPNRRYAVMVFIHGGSFAVGGADVYAGDTLSAFNDVIVVTINYRLNVFGFLSTGEKQSGNYGLWDMKLAIQWVHDNIEDYGGDTTNVTIFGNSAGGAAVLYQAIHSQNRGLFQRVIAQSGSCFAFWAIQSNPVENFNWYTTENGCFVGNFTEKLACLRKLPFDKISLANSEYRTSFVPSVDQDFLPEDPVSLSTGRSATGRAAMDFFSELYLLNGVLSKDGAYARRRWEKRMNQSNVNGVSRSYFEDSFVSLMLNRIYNIAVPTLITSVIHQYTDWSAPDDTIKTRNNLIDFQSDVTFFVPAIHASKTHVGFTEQNISRNNSFFYVFDHKPEFAPDPEWLTGATHVMELPYIFGFTKAMEIKLQKDYGVIDPFVTSEEDIKLSKQLMSFWTNFAKTGNPNSVEADSVILPKWPPYSFDEQLYLELTPNMTSQYVKHHFVASRVAFWEQLVPVLQSCYSCSVSTTRFRVINWVPVYTFYIMLGYGTDN